MASSHHWRPGTSIPNKRPWSPKWHSSVPEHLEHIFWIKIHDGVFNSFHLSISLELPQGKPSTVWKINVVGTGMVKFQNDWPWKLYSWDFYSEITSSFRGCFCNFYIPIRVSTPIHSSFSQTGSIQSYLYSPPEGTTCSKQPYLALAPALPFRFQLYEK